MNKNNDNELKLNYLRADYMSEQSEILGYGIVGSLFWEYIPDAIVIPPLELHEKYIKKRKDLVYKDVINIRKFLFKHAEKYKIPIFDKIIDQTKYLENL